MPAVQDVGGEPRVSHEDLAASLGYAEPEMLRRLIDRKRGELKCYGPLVRARDLPDGILRQIDGEIRGRGQPKNPFLLNEGQTVLAAIFSDAPRAASVRHQVVNVFLAWRAGRVATTPVQNPAPSAARLAGDPLVSALGRLLDAVPSNSWAGAFAELLAELNGRTPVGKRGGRLFWPASAKGLGKRLGNMKDDLGAAGLVLVRRQGGLVLSRARDLAVSGRSAVAAPPPAGLAAGLAELRALLERQAVQIEALMARSAAGPGRSRRVADLRDMQEADAVDLFLSGCTVAKRGAVVQARDLYLAWAEFARVAAVPANSMVWFSRQMDVRGVRKRKSSLNWYLDLRLLEKAVWAAGAVLHVEGGVA